MINYTKKVYSSFEDTKILLLIDSWKNQEVFAALNGKIMKKDIYEISEN